MVVSTCSLCCVCPSGGRVDLFNVTPETQRSVSGIFIKHVLDNSPAGRNGTLQTGDRILEVDGVDLRQATHDKAVDVIKHARSPVTFLVQSLATDDWVRAVCHQCAAARAWCWLVVYTVCACVCVYRKLT